MMVSWASMVTTVLPWPSSSVAFKAACAFAKTEPLNWSISVAAWKSATVVWPTLAKLKTKVSLAARPVSVWFGALATIVLVAAGRDRA